MLSFNRGRFNRRNDKDTKDTFFSGNARLALVSKSDKLNTISLLKGNADLVIVKNGIMNTSSHFKGKSNINFMADGSFTRTRHLVTKQNPSIANLSIFSSGKVFVTRRFEGKAYISIFSKSGTLNTINSFKGNSKINVHSKGYVNVSKSFEGASQLSLYSFGSINVIRDLEGAAHLALFTTSQVFNTFRLEYIHLPNIVLKSGDELIIDIENKTITLNGQNAMRFLSRESEFFLFNPRENAIEFLSKNEDDRANIRVLWKDAWL